MRYKEGSSQVPLGLFWRLLHMLHLTTSPSTDSEVFKSHIVQDLSLSTALVSPRNKG